MEILGVVRCLNVFDHEADGGFFAMVGGVFLLIYSMVGGRISIAFCIRRGVSIHYIWSHSLHDDPHFQTLSPISMSANPGGEGVPAGSPPHLTEPDLTTLVLGRFLQLWYPSNIPTKKLKHSVDDMKMQDSVVGFEEESEVLVQGG
jgi:hypothetical protein